MQISMSMMGIDTKSGLLESKSGVVQGSGEGNRYGFTDFSEFGVQSGVPTGLTMRQYNAGTPQNEAIINDATLGNGFQFQAAAGDYDRLMYSIDAFDDAIQFGEFLIVYTWPGYNAGTRTVGPFVMCGTLADAANSDGMDAGVYLKAGDFESVVIGFTDGSGSTLAAGDISMVESGLAGQRAYFRVRITDAGAGKGNYYAKSWVGELTDEPAGWDVTSENVNNYVDGGIYNGFGLESLANQNLQKVWYWSFSETPDTVPPPEPDFG